MSTSYLHRLSDFNGEISSSWATLRGDEVAREIYVHNPSDKTIRIFNENGMEVYRFGDDLNLVILDLAVAEDGAIYLLLLRQKQLRIMKCNFRGEAKAETTLQGVPQVFEPFAPDLLERQGERLVLVDRVGMKVGFFDRSGRFIEGIDLGAMMGLSAEQVINSGIGGFSVVGDERFLYTVPVFFKAYLYEGGSIRSFGNRGSSPGKFNVLAGIDADDRGNIFIVDTLRCVVMAFNQQFTFLSEFGYRGSGPGNLIIPRDILVQGGRVYVTEGGGRGVSVFKISYQ